MGASQEYYDCIVATGSACSEKPLSDQDMDAIKFDKFKNHFTTVRKAWLKKNQPHADAVVEDGKQKKKGGAMPAGMGITWAALKKSFATV